MKLEMDDYEAANLLWLLRVARRLGLDTGDWLGQLTHKMEGEVIRYEPNYPPSSTDWLVNEILSGKRKP